MSSALLVVLALLPWWEDLAPGGGDGVTHTGWSLLGNAVRGHYADYGTEGLWWFGASYVSFALIVLTMGVALPPDRVSQRLGAVFGLVAALGIGLAMMSLAVAGRDGVEVFDGFHGAWVMALVVSWLWSTWAADRSRTGAAA